MHVTTHDLLNDPRVINEINRFKQSRADETGDEIDFRDAANEWFLRYSSNWIKENLYDPKKKSKQSKFANRHFIFPIKREGA